MSTSANLHQIYSFRSQKTFTTEALHTKELLHQSLSTQNSVYTRKTTQCTRQKIWTAKHNKNTQTSATLKCKSLCCKVLHRTGFTPGGAYTPKPLRSKSFFTQMFGPNDFYNRRCLHQQAFTPKTFYTRGILQQRHFTPKGFLRQKVFTEAFYTGGLLQQNMFTQCTYYTKQALCIKEFLHQKTLTPPSFVLESFFEMLNHKLFTPIHSHSKRLWQQRCTLHQRPFTPTNPYTRDLLHQKPFLTPGFYAVLISPEHTYIWNFSQTVCTLYTKHFKTPENLYRGNLLQQRFNKVLHRTTLMLEALYTKEFSLQKAFT